MYIEDYSQYINKKLESCQNKKLVVWGTGKTAIKLFQCTQLLNYDISDIVDNNTAGESFLGRVVKTPSQICWQDIDAVVIAAVPDIMKQIEKELIGKWHYRNEILDWTIQSVDRPFYRCISKKVVDVSGERLEETLSYNSKFLNIHKGDRLFILCNGPSIKQMDLKKLHGEISMAVSNFYMHTDYKLIAPDYYCVPQVTYTDLFTRETAVSWFKEMFDRAGNRTQYFFSDTEKGIIENSDIKIPEKLNYVSFSSAEGEEIDEIDLTKKIIPVTSVPIMCLQIAMYMGFKEIYLIGTEYNFFAPNSKYQYFYDRDKNVAGRTDNSVDKEEALTISLGRTFQMASKLWQQFEKMNFMAQKKGIKIYNATINSWLDMFERVNYDDLF